LQNHPPPAPGSPQVHDLFRPPAPGSFEEYVSQYRSWHDSGYVGPPPAFGSSLRHTIQQYEKAPSSHADSEHPSPELGTPHLNIDQPPTSGTPELQNHPPPAPGTAGSIEDYINRYLKWHYSGRIGPEPTGSGDPRPLYQEAPPSHAPQPLEPEAPPSAPKTLTVFNDALKQGIKQGIADGAKVGAVVGASMGLTYGAVKLIEDHSHNKSQPAGGDPASGGRHPWSRRGESMHPLLPKRSVSRANDKLRHEDLRLLSILTRRALERLD